MGRRKQQPTFSSALVPFVLSPVRRGGRDAGALERKHLRAGAPGTPPQLTVPQFRELMNEAARALGDPLFGLHCAQALPRGAYGLLEFALRSAPSGALALRQLAAYGALINPAVRFTLEEDERELSLHHRAQKQADGVGPHGNVFTVARVLFMGREMLGEGLSPTRAWFAHREAKPSPELARALGTSNLSFGRSSNGIAFSRQALEAAPQGADPELNAVLELHAAALVAQLPREEPHAPVRRAPGQDHSFPSPA